jgi:hypothetical protein
METYKIGQRNSHTSVSVEQTATAVGGGGRVLDYVTR